MNVNRCSAPWCYTIRVRGFWVASHITSVIIARNVSTRLATSEENHDAKLASESGLEAGSIPHSNRHQVMNIFYTFAGYYYLLGNKIVRKHICRVKMKRASEWSVQVCGDRYLVDLVLHCPHLNCNCVIFQFINTETFCKDWEHAKIAFSQLYGSIIKWNVYEVSRFQGQSASGHIWVISLDD